MSAVVGDPDLPAYVASKGAVEMLTREIAVQCARCGYNVRCNAVLPGTIDTPMVSTYFEDPRNGPVRSEWFDRIPLGRVGTPQEAAALITFLVSDEASFLTGGSYRVDGGMTA
jgi:NAD(P)-dependent dehydrogenase (short-subunit alcohol dehydrogenase family)